MSSAFVSQCRRRQAGWIFGYLLKMSVQQGQANKAEGFTSTWAEIQSKQMRRRAGGERRPRWGGTNGGGWRDSGNREGLTRMMKNRCVGGQAREEKSRSRDRSTRIQTDLSNLNLASVLLIIVEIFQWMKIKSLVLQTKKSSFPSWEFIQFIFINRTTSCQKQRYFTEVTNVKLIIVRGKLGLTLSDKLKF